MTFIAGVLMLGLIGAGAAGLVVAINSPKHRLVASIFSAFAFLLAIGVVAAVVFIISRM